MARRWSTAGSSSGTTTAPGRRARRCRRSRRTATATSTARRRFHLKRHVPDQAGIYFTAWADGDVVTDRDASDGQTVVYRRLLVWYDDCTWEASETLPPVAKDRYSYKYRETPVSPQAARPRSGGHLLHRLGRRRRRDRSRRVGWPDGGLPPAPRLVRRLHLGGERDAAAGREGPLQLQVPRDAGFTSSGTSPIRRASTSPPGPTATS